MRSDASRWMGFGAGDSGQFDGDGTGHGFEDEWGWGTGDGQFGDSLGSGSGEGNGFKPWSSHHFRGYTARAQCEIYLTVYLGEVS